MKRNNNDLPPVIILGGSANALSVARNLGAEGIKVYVINHATEIVRYSRFCEWIPVSMNGNVSDSWASYLLGPNSNHLQGAVLLACSDDGIELIAKHREKLLERFVLDESDSAAQLCMLNKLCTYQQATAAGVPTPKFWLAETLDQIMNLREELVFPLIVKPVFSHVFTKQFKKKYLLANSFDQLLDVYQTVSKARMKVLLVEMIPGPDDRLCSYYTYLDQNSNPLFSFTKRIIRRYPENMGLATYHITDWNPEVRDVALKLFRHVGLRGLANAEFKRDERDGQLKLIECNARFTAADCLVTASGFNLALFVYNRLVGRPQRRLEKYAVGMRLWDPIRDFSSFRELKKKGRLSFWQWVASLMHPLILPGFRWNDPLPTAAKVLQHAKKVQRLVK
jgi:D-aspartate ligase